jgi:hypothetical protein
MLSSVIAASWLVVVRLCEVWRIGNALYSAVWQTVRRGSGLNQLFRSEHRAKLVPPELRRLVADVGSVLEQQILDLPQPKRLPDVHRHGQADYLGRTVEIADGIFHPSRLRNSPSRLKSFYSDNTPLN